VHSLPSMIGEWILIIIIIIIIICHIVLAFRPNPLAGPSVFANDINFCIGIWKLPGLYRICAPQGRKLRDYVIKTP
jgi:hypothetical protein